MATLPTINSISVEGMSEEERKILGKLIPQLNEFMGPAHAALAGNLKLGENLDAQVATLDFTIADDWIDATLLNSWINYPGFGNAQYRKTERGKVEVCGLVKDGTISTNIFAMAETYWPPFERLFGSIANTGAGYTFGDLRVTVGGGVQVHTVGGANQWVSLDNIEYAAADPTPPANLDTPVNMALTLRERIFGLIPVGGIDLTDPTKIVPPFTVHWAPAVVGPSNVARISALPGLLGGRKYRIALLAFSG